MQGPWESRLVRPISFLGLGMRVTSEPQTHVVPCVRRTDDEWRI